MAGVYLPSFFLTEHVDLGTLCMYCCSISAVNYSYFCILFDGYSLENNVRFAASTRGSK